MEPRHSGLSLNLGSGGHRWPGWINCDGYSDRADVCCELTALPYGDGVADRIAAIHVLEHFYQWEGEPLLKEWARVLKPGGQLILELPCLDKIFSYITHCMTKQKELWLAYTVYAFWGDPKYQSVPMCHKWGYSMTSLEILLQSCGFLNARFEEPNYHFPDRDMRCVAIKGAN